MTIQSQPSPHDFDRKTSQLPVDFTISNSLADFLAVVDSAETEDEVWECTVDFARGLGASHIGVNLFADGVDPFVRWTTPPWVKNQFFEQFSLMDDPGAKHCSTQLTPYFAGEVFEGKDHGIAPVFRDYINSLVEVDIRSAVMIPVHQQLGRSWGKFIFETGLGRQDFMRFYRENGTVVHLVGLIVIERMKLLRKISDSPSVTLSGRERECLHWLTQGFRNDRIAERLGIRPVTVEFHITKACRKLGARTRSQAVVRALQQGMLDL